MGDELLDLIEVPDMETPEDLKDKVKQEEDVIENLDLPGGDDKPPAEQRDEEVKEEVERTEEEEIEYSKSVQKRINKLTGRAKAAEERAAAAEAALEVARAEQFKKSQETTDEKLLALTEKRKQAIEDGDLESVAMLSDEIYELRLEKRQPPPPPKQEAPPQPQGRHEAAEAWIERNSWYSEPGNDARKRLAEAIQDELLEEGMSLSDALYSELDERLKARERKAQSPTGSKPGHLSAPSDPGIPSASKPKPGQLTQYDIKTMRQFKLDPNNPQHRASYLKRRSS